MKKYKTNFSKEELHAALHANDKEAAVLIEDEDEWVKFKDKFEAFLKKAEKIPVLGGLIDDIVCMVSLVDSYVRREYRNIPTAAILSIAAALVYLLSPIDLIPNAIPVIGYLDDASVVLLLLGFGIDQELDKYREWQEQNRKSALIAFEQLLAEELAQVIGENYLAAVIVDDDAMKMLVTEERDSEPPIACSVKMVKVPLKALAEYDATEQGEIAEVLNETVKAECIYWTKQAQRQVYSEPDFEEKWDDYMIEEGS